MRRPLASRPAPYGSREDGLRRLGAGVRSSSAPRPVGARPPDRGPSVSTWGRLVLDIVYVLGVIAVFVLVAGIGKAVEKL
ncbi:hypothetical protein SAMN04487781_0134 [Cellulosimicrobium cellulans]|nr:hypothetical protein SAMN04487781_0134 [Cellulosimicrobium cellulans]